MKTLARKFWSLRSLRSILFAALYLTIAQASFGGATSQRTSVDTIAVDRVDLELTTATGELVPIICRFASAKQLEPVQFRLSNKANSSSVVTISARIRDWSDSAEKTVELGGHETKTIPLSLAFKRELYRNNEVADAQIEYKIKQGSNLIWSDTRPIKIAAKGTMIWSLKQSMDMAFLVAAFVNPHDPKVEEILSRAKERMPSRTLMGYQKDPDEQKKETYREAKAIVAALAEYGLSYVNSSVSFSGHQRIRTPSESIIQKSANCIDGAVLYASLFENLGMEPLIIIGPGHAFVGVRLYPDSEEALFIETTMTSQYPSSKQTIKQKLMQSLAPRQNGDLESEIFAKITDQGAAEFEEWSNAKNAHIIDVKQTRSQGIMPAFTE